MMSFGINLKVRKTEEDYLIPTKPVAKDPWSASLDKFGRTIILSMEQL